MKSITTLVTCTLAALLWLSGAGLLSAQDQGTRLLREPTVSQEHIVFAYANDLWITGRQGGEARRLTSHAGGETDPHSSPTVHDRLQRAVRREHRRLCHSSRWRRGHPPHLARGR
ncbi:MAG: hypothetical protein U5K31_06365 [Balneolaceae bacterium]|nr:hypothetical protein [Balneolaceae bacterium]